MNVGEAMQFLSTLDPSTEFLILESNSTVNEVKRLALARDWANESRVVLVQGFGAHVNGALFQVLEEVE